MPPQLPANSDTPPPHTERFRQGVCTRVTDGDTVSILFDGEPHARAVQLAGITAPEKGEPYTAEARAYLRALLEGKRPERIACNGKDRFGRELCRLFLGGEEVNRSMILAGWARYHHRYADANGYAAAEAEAIAARRGMWRTLCPKSGETAAVKDGTCLKVLDGDTIIFREAGAADSIKIRLWGIDAPEKEQDFGAEATRRLAKLIEHKRVQLHFHEEARDSAEGQDGYSRHLATIYRDGCNINLAMVEEGFAWHYAYYAPAEQALAAAEQAARAARRGLWSEEQPLEPRCFRRAQKALRDTTLDSDER